MPVSGYIHFTWTATVLLQIVNKQRSRQAKHRELWEAGRERERAGCKCSQAHPTDALHLEHNSGLLQCLPRLNLHKIGQVKLRAKRAEQKKSKTKRRVKNDREKEGD